MAEQARGPGYAARAVAEFGAAWKDSENRERAAALQAAEPKPYDIDHALDELRGFRDCTVAGPRGDIVREAARIGDKLAVGMRTNFTPEQLDLVGRVMIVVGASIGALSDIPASVVCNVVGFAGQAIVDHQDTAAGDGRG